MESCALLLPKGGETWIRECVVGMEVVETWAVADAVDSRYHREMGGERVDNRDTDNGMWMLLERVDA